MFVLILCRPLFRKVAFHFHASGLHENLENRGVVFRFFFRMAFANPDLSISPSRYCTEGRRLHAKKRVVVPYGVPPVSYVRQGYSRGNLKLLFVGLLDSTKGELLVLSAMSHLRARGVNVSLTIAGVFKGGGYKKDFFEEVSRYGMESLVSYVGVVQGGAKGALFESADVFCFPSFFPSESYPVVLIEAMQYSLPIVASRWRGIPDMVEHGKNGFLVDAHDGLQVANALERLHRDRPLLAEMGRCGRAQYEQRYTLQGYLGHLERELAGI